MASGQAGFNQSWTLPVKFELYFPVLKLLKTYSRGQTWLAHLVFGVLHCAQEFLPRVTSQPWHNGPLCVYTELQSQNNNLVQLKVPIINNKKIRSYM